MYTCTDKYIFSIGGLIQPGNKGFSDANEIFDLETGTFHHYFTEHGANMQPSNITQKYTLYTIDYKMFLWLFLTPI